MEKEITKKIRVYGIVQGEDSVRPSADMQISVRSGKRQ